MNKIRELFKLHDNTKLSNRQIAKVLNISRPVVGEYLTILKNSGYTCDEICRFPDTELLNVLQGTKKEECEKYKVLHAKFPGYIKELKRVGVTRQTLWEEYRQVTPDSYSYSQFCYHFQMWQNLSEVTMHIEHKAGDKLFVDFTGKKLSVTDRISGEIQEVEVFVALLGSSQLTYVEAALSQKKQEWIRLNENALRYIGGVPKAIMPDCLKSAITKTGRYEMDVNREYADFAQHYGAAIFPARPAKPKDKALVEGAVRIVYSWIFARLRDRIFFSLEELNIAIWELLETYNSKKMQHAQISRRELFEQTERNTLSPLPVMRYEFKNFKRLLVQFSYHIFLSEDHHYYSVPYRYKGKRVDIWYSQRDVEIYYNNERIAFHKRCERKNGYTTIREHMPDSHKWQDKWNPETLMTMATAHGDEVASMIQSVLAARQYPEQSYRSCLGILSLAKRYGAQRLNKACGKALQFENYTYKMINNILVNGLDAVHEQEQLALFGEHENIRGIQYYMEVLQ
jgi:transposase